MRKRNQFLRAMGMIPKYQFELPASGKERRFSLDESAADDARPTRLTLLYSNEVLAVADSEFERRGIYLSWCGFGGLVILLFFLVLGGLPVYTSAPYWMTFAFALVTLPLTTGFWWLAWEEIKGYAVSPVIFNRRTGNVHFFSIHNGQPVTYPWRRCTYCIVPKRAGGPEGRDYEVRGYVLNEYDGVLESFSIGEEMINLGHVAGSMTERWLSYQFEYVRQFMTLQDISSLDTPKEDDYVSLKSSFRQSMEIVDPKVDSKSLVIKVLSALMSVVTFIPKVVGGAGHYLCCKYCKVPQWSPAIIEECGPEIVLSNR
ncbi:DUF6708 domain-containing protein [Chromohalobacter nigrandesensis]|uniref:DUF6708 domain-containing protein n=1 Tax=Chromohalobacter nigrandesensis TaxID=119863 RepID=UPI001FF5FA24|nr:hypothetical protein [Chromohalobacter nigrandesensis]MCK0746810.1 hypothetical protein [Chromohalobacter nigrandesensis]